MLRAATPGERRLVTALFADVVNSTALAEEMDPEDWASIMSRAIDLMTEAVERYEGTVSQMTGDGIMAMFGAPVAHEDDPTRAVRAGLAMLRDVAAHGADLRRTHGIDFAIRVGAHTGTIVIRELGATVGGPEGAFGDTLNLAARMQAAADPGTLLVTRNTHDLIRGAFFTRSVGSLTVKGRREAVEAYAVEKATGVARPTRGLPGITSVLVGRETEMERLTQLLAAVRAGQGRVAAVIGEPGIGKSRLVSELRDRAAAAGVSGWVEARCISYGQSQPHHLVVDLVRALCGLPEPIESVDPAEAAEALRAAARRLLGDADGSTAAYLAHLLSLPGEGWASEQIGHMEPKTLHGYYIESLTTLLRGAASEAPLVVVCDDMHWADESSVSLIAPALNAIHGGAIMLLLVTRPDRDVPGWKLINSARERFGDAMLELRLEPLSEDHGRQLVANLLEIESLPEAVRGRILERAGGNPFFTEEIIRMMIDRGLIIQEQGRWRATADVASIEIPETLHGLLLARIDRLPPETRRTLKIAAVIGRQFPVRVLAEVAEGS